MMRRRALCSVFLLLPLLLLLGLPAAAAGPADKLHKVAIQVDGNDPALMNLALNNVTNIARHYSELGEKVEIEVVTYGPGLHMLRADTSPVQDRIKSITGSMPNVKFMACANTRAGMQKAEGKEIPLLPVARIVPSGVVYLMEREEAGWSYIRP